MRLRNILKICLAFCKSEPQYAYKRHAYKKTCMCDVYVCMQSDVNNAHVEISTPTTETNG